MANVSVGLAAVQNAQTICSGAIQDLNSSAQKLNNRYREAWQHWRDKKYEQLGGIINDCSNALKSPVDELFDCLNKLKQIEKALLKYESVKIIDAYLGESQSNYGTSRRDRIITAAMSRVDSPSLTARLIGEVAAPDDSVSEPLTQLTQMVIDAAIPATQAFMEGVIDQHGESPAVALERMRIHQAIIDGASTYLDEPLRDNEDYYDENDEIIIQ